MKKRLIAFVLVVFLLSTSCSGKKHDIRIDNINDFLTIYFTANYKNRYSNLNTLSASFGEKDVENYFKFIKKFLTERYYYVFVQNRGYYSFDKQYSPLEITVKEVSIIATNDTDYDFVVSLVDNQGMSYTATGNLRIEGTKISWFRTTCINSNF